MRSTLIKQVMLALVILLSLMSLPVCTNAHNVTFTMDDFSFSKVDGYDLVLLKDGAYLTDLGKPKLPSRSIRVVIPPGQKIADITIEETSRLELEGAFSIYPCQEFETNFLPPPPFLPPDPEVYEQDNQYPGKLLISSGESYLCGSYKIAHLLVFPLQYLPKSKKLYLYDSITFTLVLEQDEHEAPIKNLTSKASKKSCDAYLRESVINPEDADTYNDLHIIKLGDISMDKSFHTMNVPANMGIGPKDYIIITSDMTMAAAFMPLAKWRIKKGILTEIYTVPWIELNYDGVDIQEKIKNFIYDCYANRGTRHVLLGGNSDLIPVRYSYIYHYDTYHNGEAATDLYYSNCTVGDEAWEIHEGPKSPTPHVTYNPPKDCSINAIIPKVSLGRLLVANEDQAQIVVNKILTYERDVPAKDYHQSFIFHNSGPGDDIYTKWVDPTIPDYLIPNTRILLGDGTGFDGESSPENIIKFMTGGSDLGVPFNFAWSDSHGSSFSLQTYNGFFGKREIEKIVNQPRYSGSFYAIACSSANIGYTRADILPAAWVNLPNGGGIAWIGSSVTAGGDHGNWHVRYYHEEMWKDSQDYHHHNLGRAFAEAKTRMIENFPDPPCNPLDPPYHCRWCRYHAIIWNLVGDPMVPIFNRMPGTLDVTVYPQVVEPDTTETISITVEDEGDPVEGAFVCLMNSNENLYLTDFTDSNGECRFRLSPLSIGSNIAVTITKYNYRPYETTMQVGGVGYADIIDNTDLRFSKVGYWKVSAKASGFYGSDYRYAFSGDGSAIATFTFEIPVDGNYEISAQWPAHSSRATDAPYSLINNGATIDTVLANQQINGGQFNLLSGASATDTGIYQLSAGMLEVTLSNDAHGKVAADAVKLVRMPDPIEPVDEIVDNTDPQFSKIGYWKTSDKAVGFYGTDYRYAYAGDGSAIATFSFEVPADGNYEISAQWPAHFSRAPDTPFALINNGDVIDTVLVDQRINGGQFNSLIGPEATGTGTYALSAGVLEVTLSDDASGKVAADAVHLVSK